MCKGEGGGRFERALSLSSALTLALGRRVAAGSRLASLSFAPPALRPAYLRRAPAASRPLSLSMAAGASTDPLAVNQAPHINARSQQNPRYPQRATVADNQVAWAEPFPGYVPTFFEDPKMVAASWADPQDVSALRTELQSRISFEGAITFDSSSGAPMNPRGRTGINGRGTLGKWGPNHAADPIVTRLNPESGQLQVVAIQRKDTGAWALPGGMVDPGENCSVTVKREFTEEAGEISDPARKAEFQRLTDELFASGTVIYRGYVDDPRNTDNAWMETTAFHFHCSAALGSLLPLEAGDDAAKVQWLDVDAANPHYAHLYAGHKDWVDEAQRRLSKSSL